MKKFAETPEELLIKENMTSRIVVERLSLRLDVMEEDNKELVTDFQFKVTDFKEQAADDFERINEY